MTARDLAYRRTAYTGASGFGLLTALYDTLAGDLRRAAAAQREGNLEKRARDVKHALLVISYLENWLEPERGELARNLARFYGQMRRKIMEAQAKQSAEMLEEQMTAALEVRRTWQQLESRETDSGPEILPPVRNEQYSGVLSAQAERRQLSWSA